MDKVKRMTSAEFRKRPYKSQPQTPAKAKVRPRHRKGAMNKTEQRFADHLDRRKAEGRILDWRFEAQSFKLASQTTYTPDFRVVYPDGSIIHFDVKGTRKGKAYWEQHTRIKAKAAASEYREYTFAGVHYHNGEWITEIFPHE